MVNVLSQIQNSKSRLLPMNSGSIKNQIAIFPEQCERTKHACSWRQRYRTWKKAPMVCILLSWLLVYEKGHNFQHLTTHHCCLSQHPREASTYSFIIILASSSYFGPDIGGNSMITKFSQILWGAVLLLMAAITNDYKLGGLIQSKFILS